MSDITIRPTHTADADVLDRLAALDSARRIAGPALIAEICGTPVAALDIATGRTVADPFRRTADVVELLRMRGASVRGHGRSHRLRGLIPRLA